MAPAGSAGPRWAHGCGVAVAPSLPQTPKPGVAVAFARRPTLGIASPMLAPAARM